ncbi:TolC family protein [Verrucomicrobiaceae bacterium 5K15]|uniref:TolC family protein n=1 Tax=Oceaniferula flava TaxID=2800421 RepID=A0AAE2S9K0_9BACT|nr:TolC family protein [Oceaniferula flavus]MBK1853865.1 TolC family protein [Oceaniferula flavus]MBM1135171.1 TolC family protein [Oceaniferula flavus]
MKLNQAQAIARRYSVCGLATLLIGCVGKPPASSIGKVAGVAPGSWSATQQAKAGVDDNWVSRFGDSRLNGLVREALSQNHDMRIAAERVYRAAEAAKISDATSRPQVGLSADGTRQKVNYVGFPFGGAFISNSFGVEMSVDWEPDIWGSARAGKSAALAEWQAGGQDYRAARASLAAQVCKAWFALAEANEQVALAKEALAIRKKTETAVRERFERNLIEEGGSASQLRLAQTDVASAKADLSGQQGDLESARRQLELLVGRYPAGKISGSVRMPRVPSSPPSGLPSELLLRRPDIIAAERRYSGTIKRVKEAKLSVFPSFKLTGTSGTTTSSLGQILNSDFGVWSLGSSIALPVLTGGRVTSEIRSRRSNQREALATLHKTVLEAFGEVEKALAAERWLKRREAEMAEAVTLAKDAAQAADDDFRDGNGDALTLFSAQTRRIQLQSQYASLRRVRLTNRVDLHLALGGGFKVSP